MNGTNGSILKEFEELSVPVPDASQQQDRVTSVIWRTLARCGALLQQKLGSRSQDELQAYFHADIDRIMRAFGGLFTGS